MSSTSRLDDLPVEEYSRDVLISLVRIGKKIVIRDNSGRVDSPEDLDELIVNKMPLIAMSNNSLIQELRNLTGSHNEPMTFYNISNAYGGRMIGLSELETALLVSSPFADGLRRLGLVLEVDTDYACEYHIKRMQDMIHCSIHMSFNDDGVTLDIWEPSVKQEGIKSAGNTRVIASLEFANPECHPDGIFQILKDEYDDLMIDPDYEIDQMQEICDEMNVRLKEIEEWRNKKS